MRPNDVVKGAECTIEEGVCIWDEDRLEAKKLTLPAGNALELHEGTWLVPVMEPMTIMIGNTTQVDDEPQKNETEIGKDFNGGKPKLTLPKHMCAQEINGYNHCKTNCDPFQVNDGLVLVVDENSSHGELSWQCDYPQIPVVPAHCKGQGGINETAG